MQGIKQRIKIHTYLKVKIIRDNDQGVQLEWNPPLHHRNIIENVLFEMYFTTFFFPENYVLVCFFVHFILKVKLDQGMNVMSLEEKIFLCSFMLSVGTSI